MEVTETDVQELVELAAQSTGDLSTSQAKWIVSPAVCRRYLAAAASASKPGAAAALPFLLRSARWRDEWAVDAMLEDYALAAFERSLPAVLLYEVCIDASGRSVMVERVVNEQIRVRLDSGGGADRRGGAADRRAVLVFDLQGLGVGHLACRSLLRLFATLSRLDSEHFPDTVGTIVCVDAPRAFAALWAVVSRLVATGTRQKLLVYASTARAEALGALRELCGAACLPRELGGARDDAPPYSSVGIEAEGHVDHDDQPEEGVDVGETTAA